MEVLTALARRLELPRWQELPLEEAARLSGEIEREFEEQSRYEESARRICESTGCGIDQASLACALVMAGRVRKTYEEKRLPEQLYWDTLSDLRIWCENCILITGRPGLRSNGWLRLHLSARLFRLGRLQFELYTLDRPVAGLPAGEPALHVHIPQGEPLGHEACLASYARAERFFPESLGYHPRIFLCHSWLLHPNLQRILPETSNILKFQREFTLYEQDEDAAQALERIFGLDFRAGQPYPQDTSLQRAAKRFLESGGVLGMGSGYRRIS